MTWTHEAIELEWLRDGRIAVRPETIVEAFNRAEQVLGRDWIESSRTVSRVVSYGSLPTLRVVTMGQHLAALDGVVGADRIIDRLRRGDNSAEAELASVHLIRFRHPAVEAELYPRVSVGASEKEPDLRVRMDDEHWTYVEVAQPDFSEDYARAQAILERLAALVREMRRLFALEIFLRREPTDAEVELLMARVPFFCERQSASRDDLPDNLGMLLLSDSPPGQVILQDHPGEDDRPRVGMATIVSGANEPPRHIAIRMAFADERAEEFMTREAKQLPTDSPGVVMIETNRAPGGFKSWEPLVRRRLQPTQHTRVSTVCLFSSGLTATEGGEAWLPETKLIANPHARFQLPRWLTDALANARGAHEASLYANET